MLSNECNLFKGPELHDISYSLLLFSVNISLLQKVSCDSKISLVIFIIGKLNGIKQTRSQQKKKSERSTESG